MKKLLFMLFMVVTVFNLGLTAYGADIKPLSKQIFQEDVDFNNTNLADLLAIISKASNVSIVADSKIKDTKINLYIHKGNSLKKVLKIIKATNNFYEVKIGKIIMFTSGGTPDTKLVGKVTDIDNNGIQGVQIRLGYYGYKTLRTQKNGIFIFDHIRPGTYILKIAKRGFVTTSEIVNVKKNKINYKSLVINRRRTALRNRSKVGTEIMVKQLGSIKNASGLETVTERIQLKYAFVKDIKKVVDSVLGDSIKITSFPKLDIIVLQGDQSNVNIAKKLINDLDRPVKQIRITVQILDTSDNLFEDLGFSWLFSNDPNITGQSLVSGSGSAAVLADQNARTIASFDGLTFIDIFSKGKNLLNFTLSMLQNTEDLSVTSVPSVVVVNGETANFKVTREVIVGEKETSDDDDNTVKEPIFEEAGTIFEVTPTVRKVRGQKDIITLDIKSELSDFKLSALGTYNSKGGSKIKNDIDTKIQVHDGDVIFIGGLKRTSTRKSIEKVPILGDIPYLGTLFRKSSTANDVRQIYIQITAEIVRKKNQNADLGVKKFRSGPSSTGKLERVFPVIKTNEK